MYWRPDLSGFAYLAFEEYIGPVLKYTPWPKTVPRNKKRNK